MMSVTSSNGSLAERGNSIDGSPVVFASGMTLAEVEKEVIIETLRRQNNNRTRAARVLGIGIRTLQRKLKVYGTDFEMPVASMAINA